MPGGGLYRDLAAGFGAIIHMAHAFSDIRRQYSDRQSTLILFIVRFNGTQCKELSLSPMASFVTRVTIVSVVY
jgi:hypothetical protein